MPLENGGYGQSLMDTEAKAVSIAGALQQQRLQQMEEQRARQQFSNQQTQFGQQQEEMKRRDIIRAGIQEAGGDPRRLRPEIRGMLTPEEARATDLHAMKLDERDATVKQRGVLGDYLGKMQGAGPEAFSEAGGAVPYSGGYAPTAQMQGTPDAPESPMMMGPEMPVPEDPGYRTGFVPRASLARARDSYLESQTNAQTIQDMAPLAREGFFDGKVGDVVRMVDEEKKRPLAMARENRLASAAEAKQTSEVRQGLLKEKIEEWKRQADADKEAGRDARAAAQRVVELERIAAQERNADKRNEAMLRAVAAKGEQKVSVNAASQDQVDVIAPLIAEGRAFLSDFGKRSPQFQAALLSKVVELNPTYDVGEAEANKKMKQNTVINRSIQILDSITETMPEFMAANAKLGLSSFPAWNKAKLFWMEQSGNPDYTAFVNWKNAYSMELANALSGAAATDMRIKIELENMKTAASPAQFKAAYDVLTSIIKARKDAFRAPVFPQAGGKGKPDPLGLR
jgi:hypothetical protein